MSISAFCRRPMSQARVNEMRGLGRFSARARGFTLLELLIVLVIIGLMAGLVGPQLSLMAARVEFAMNRESFERALASLPYEAFRQRQDLVLRDQNTASRGNSDNEDSNNFIIRAEGGKTVSFPGPVLYHSVELPMPSGWQIEVKAPIVFRVTGFCSGGDVTVRVADYIYSYELMAPDCRPRSKQ